MSQMTTLYCKLGAFGSENDKRDNFKKQICFGSALRVGAGGCSSM